MWQSVDIHRTCHGGSFLLQPALPGVKLTEVTDPSHMIFLSLVTWPNVGSFSQGQTRHIPNTKATSSAKYPIALPKNRGSRVFQIKGCIKEKHQDKQCIFSKLLLRNTVILSQISVNNSVWGRYPVCKISAWTVKAVKVINKWMKGSRAEKPDNLAVSSVAALPVATYVCIRPHSVWVDTSGWLWKPLWESCLGKWTHPGCFLCLLEKNIGKRTGRGEK